MASSEMAQARLMIDKNEHGSRLDRVLIRRIGQEKRSLIMRLIRKGNVRLNGKRVKPEVRVNEGDELFLPASLRDNAENDSTQAPTISHINLDNIPILYEDDALLVLNKPAGIVVHGGSGHDVGLIEALKVHRNLPDLRLAHRLDRDTSGCLLLAKELHVLRALTESFRERTAHKTYLAWVTGHPYPYAGRMQSKLSKGIVRGGERMVIDSEDGKDAITDYQVILTAAHHNWPYSLIALQPESGRTHQLRVQLQNENHAILGDPKYAEREDLQHFKDIKGKGLALHAWRLKIQHPVSGESLDLRAEWPKRWNKSFSLIKNNLCSEINL
ncbi:MAG: RluA family pseudouridine synthase [Mariprofundaceae bacterium]